MLELRKPSEIMIGDRTLEDILHDVHLNLNHTDLSNVDFTGANLVRASLRWSNLSDSVFENANLSGAKLSHANLRGAKFINARCENLLCDGADLSSVYISGSDFTHSTMSDLSDSTKLQSAKIQDSDFTYAHLECSNFVGAKIERTRFYNTYLGYANFSDSKITDTNFQYADLRHANFNGVDFFDNIDITRAKLSHANFACCDLSGAAIIGNLAEYRKGKVLTEPIIGYKVCVTDDKRYSTIVTLEIPRGAIVFSINGDKCRTNRAKVIDIDNGYKRAYADYKYFSYYIGDEINIYDFDLQYNNECSSGIHFFMTREEAENY